MIKISSYLRMSLGILLGLVFLGQSALSQVTTATILGRVTDETQAVLPGVSVTIRNVGTGIVRTSVTNDEGGYRVSNLALGDYAVEASLPGFQTAVRTGITLTLGREAVVNLTLQLGEISERVTVTGEASLVETTTSALADLVDTQKIEDLPLNGRSYTQLALLQPGVSTIGGSGFGTVSGGGAKLSISGTRTTSTAFYIDGTNAKGALGHTPGSAAGTTLGVDTIREFSILTNNISAEYGGGGGVINTVTKSGTNDFHGSVFEYHRNSALDARDFFDPGAEPAPFKRNQFGFTVGGPIVRDQTFFFGSYEGLKDRRSNSTILSVPTAEVKAGMLPDGPVAVNPVIQRYLDVMPLPNGLIGNDGTGDYHYTQSQTTDENYFMVKVDHQFSDADAFFVRYTFDDADRIDPRPFEEFFQTFETRTQYATVEETHIFSPALFNTFQVGFNRSLGGDVNQVQGLDESYVLIKQPERIPPSFSIPGLSSWGPAATSDRYAILNSYQIKDKVSYMVGRHSIRTGFEFQRIQYNGANRPRMHGNVVFNTYRDFLEGKMRTWEFMGVGTGVTGSVWRGFRQNVMAFFVQDDFQVMPNLSLNLGLRWEFVTIPTEVAGRISNYRDPLNEARATVGDPFFLLGKNNFGPRVGFAWDPSGEGKMAIRGGAGLFHDQMIHSYWRLPAAQNDPFFLRVSQSNPGVFPPTTDFNIDTLPPVEPAPMQYDLKTPYNIQYTLTVQRQIFTDMVVAISYVGSKGTHLGRFANWNVTRFQLCPCADDPASANFDESTLPAGTKYRPAGSPRFNPALAGLGMRQFDTNSHYDSLQLRLSKRFTEGLQIQGSYTFGKNIDAASNQEGLGGGGWDVSSLDPYDWRRDRGRSSLDVRQNFVFNFSYDLPGSNLSGIAAHVIGGWQTNGILNVNTGTPSVVRLGHNHSRDLNNTTTSSPGRPDLKAGASNNPTLAGGVQCNRDCRYLDGSAFELSPAGTLGNLGRNTISKPVTTTFDFSLMKRVHVDESRYFQLRAEFFNLFNHTNFGTPNGTVFSNTSGNVASNFGRITGTATTSRQIQFALKFLF